MWNKSLFPFLPDFHQMRNVVNEQNEIRIAEQKNKYLRVVLSRKCSRLTMLLEGELKESWIEDYSTAISECVDAFSIVDKSISQYKKESIVIAACLGKNKLFDYFRNVIDFYNNNINPTQSAEKIAVKGYSNYLFVIRCLMRDLIEEYEAFEMVEGDFDITHRKFLKEECSDNEILNYWQAFRERAKSALVNESTETVEIANLIQESEQFEVLLKKDKDILCTYMAEKKEAYLERKLKIEKDITDGKELYKELNCLLTEDLFEGFNPDSQDEFSKDFEQVKDEYRMLTDEFSRIINKYSRV